MVWSYTGNPLTSDLDLIRLLIGDTDIDEQLLTDAELIYFNSTFGFPYGSAAQAARAIAAKYARMVNTRNSVLWVYGASRFDHYMALINQFEDQGAAFCTIVVGGISRADREAILANSNLLGPSFEIGQDDAPGGAPSGPYDYGQEP